LDLHEQCVNTIKGLAMDAIQAANSGHPGMPLGMASAATVLWREFLKHDPTDPAWANRDRFVLSPGHGSMLLYSLLHLSGYDLPLDEIRRFRQWGSATPGHPEYGHTPGVETTTGPLGQGFAMGVGMALAERYLRESFGPDLVDHNIYGIVSDGDLMEGVAAEAASLAGHLQLGKIVYLYDDNRITIDGSTDLTMTENVGARFEAYGWHVVHLDDGHDPVQVERAIEEARLETARPSLILCPTVIGQGSSKEGSEKTHGSPLGEDDVRATKQRIGLDPEKSFQVPDIVCEAFREHDGPAENAAWQARMSEHPLGPQLQSWLARDGAAAVAKVKWPTFEVGTKLATRKASQACLRAITSEVPWIVGGSADLTGSNGTNLGTAALSPTRFAGAPMIHFGIREHAMGSMANGIALHGGLRPFSATFLVFHDYQRPAVRLSALMRQPVIYIYTHDSVFLGEDGPTHQPVETLASMRTVPRMRTLRPADANETAAAWRFILGYTDGPVALVLTRQGLPIMEETRDAEIARGAYVLSDVDDPAVVLLASGSEVPTVLAAREELATAGIAARVVSVPCMELFLAQDEAYRKEVLLDGVPRVSVEAGLTFGWERLVGDQGLSIGIEDFGASAPASVLAEKMGLTPDAVAQRVEAFLS